MKKINTVLIVILQILILLNKSYSQSISAGNNHSLFFCKNNKLLACGRNDVGCLGDNSTVQKNSPVQITSSTGFVSVTAGNAHSFFLKNDGTVWSCGFNSNGELGNGSTAPDSIPVQISGLSNVIDVALGGTSVHSLFLKNDGTVWACGNNQDGQLGNGTTSGSNPNPVPTQIPSLNGIRKIAVGADHSIFLKNDGTVWACGSNAYGQLGNGSLTSTSIPSQVNISNVTAIAAGQWFSLFIKSDSTVWACGANGNGELGDGSTTDNANPVQVTSLSKIIAISAGGLYSLFLHRNGTVWSCGRNWNGQLGNGSWDTNPHSTPVQIPSLTGIISISAGMQHSLFLKNDSTIWASGDNTVGQLGNGTSNNFNPIPAKVAGLCGSTGINENNLENTVFLYPNPTREQAVFSLNNEVRNALLNVYNLNGSKVAQLVFSGKHVVFNREGLENGIYFCQIISENKIFVTRKIVVE